MKFTFETLNKSSTDIANGILGKLHTKEKARDTILMMAALACESYTRDAEFKKQIDNYIKHKRITPHKA